MRYLYFMCLSIFSSFCVAQNYEPQQLESSDVQVSLIELYTSEGCSSCPPADEWMSTLTEKSNLWKDFVPVAFHVDYWDYLGWKDKFADAKYSQRQRQYARQSRESTIYTPGFRAEGRDWRSWYNANLENLSDITREKVGVLSFDIAKDGSFLSQFVASNGKTDSAKRLTVALLGLGLETKVKRGENWGKTLKHDFVVLETQTYQRQKEGWKGKVPISALNAPIYAIAVWVDDGKNLRPIQVVGAYL